MTSIKSIHAIAAKLDYKAIFVTKGNKSTGQKRGWNLVMNEKSLFLGGNADKALEELKYGMKACIVD